jgi:hypothetical protein
MSLVQPSEQRMTCLSFEPPSFAGLGLVPFQINPHFLDADPNSTHMGETGKKRILQFLEENDTPVAGLREGAMVLAENDSYLLKGSSGARIFRKGQDPLKSGGRETRSSIEIASPHRIQVRNPKEFLPGWRQIGRSGQLGSNGVTP